MAKREKLARVVESSGGEGFVHRDDVGMSEAGPRLNSTESRLVHEAEVFGEGSLKLRQ